MGGGSSVAFGTLTTGDFCTAASGSSIQCTTASTGSGNVVLATGPTVSTLTVSSGGATITAGGLTVSAGGANITGTVTGTIFSGSGANLTNIGTTNMTAVSGTPDDTTYLRGDGTWSPISIGTSDLSGTVTVPHGGTGLTSGTSGGIPYFSGATTMASSAALTANMPVIGGGAGTAPSVGTVTGNTTKFATATGTLPRATARNGMRAATSSTPARPAAVRQRPPAARTHNCNTTTAAVSVVRLG